MGFNSAFKGLNYAFCNSIPIIRIENNFVEHFSSDLSCPYCTDRNRTPVEQKNQPSNIKLGQGVAVTVTQPIYEVMFETWAQNVPL